MEIFLAIGGIGLVILLASLLFGEFGGHAELLDSGDYLSVAALAGFAAAFGFTGALLVESTGTLIASVGGAVAGAIVAALTVWLTGVLRRQETPGAPGREALLGLTGTVVSAVPGNGFGEVNLVLAGHPTKVNARSLEPIERGTRVTVVEVLSATAVRVEPVRGPTALP